MTRSSSPRDEHCRGVSAPHAGSRGCLAGRRVSGGVSPGSAVWRPCGAVLGDPSGRRRVRTRRPRIGWVRSRCDRLALAVTLQVHGTGLSLSGHSHDPEYDLLTSDVHVFNLGFRGLQHSSLTRRHGGLATTGSTGLTDSVGVDWGVNSLSDKTDVGWRLDSNVNPRIKVS